jgi:O-acetyl-ADP-ribose deacetylase (regulator of RNase III)
VIVLDTGVREFTIRLVLERGGVAGSGVERSGVETSKTVELHGPADITLENTDAIVNAANSSLLGGGGVDGAIHRAGGPAILAECRQIVSKIGTLLAGKAVITSGGNLTAKFVIHTVGPIYRGGQNADAEELASCHREAIRLADAHGLQSLSFPAISTGAYGYPVSDAAPIAIAAAVEPLGAAQHVKLVRFVLFDVSTLKAYTRAAERFANSDSASSSSSSLSLSCKIEKGPS